LILLVIDFHGRSENVSAIAEEFLRVIEVFWLKAIYESIWRQVQRSDSFFTDADRANMLCQLAALGYVDHSKQISRFSQDELKTIKLFFTSSSFFPARK